MTPEWAGVILAFVCLGIILFLSLKDAKKPTPDEVEGRSDVFPDVVRRLRRYADSNPDFERTVVMAKKPVAKKKTKPLFNLAIALTELTTRVEVLEAWVAKQPKPSSEVPEGQEPPA